MSKAEPALASDTAGGRLETLRNVSADGRYVVFISRSTSVVAGQVDTNGTDDVFLFDRLTWARTLVSHVPGSPLTTGDRDAFSPAITSDGSCVVFASFASNLAPGQLDLNGGRDIFLFERATGAVTLVSHSLGGANVTGDQPAGGFSIGANGAFVAFESFATDLAAADANGDVDVFLWSRATNTTSVVSHAALLPAQTANGNSNTPSISGDGAYVAFSSAATNLLPGQVDAPGTGDVFLFERSTGAILLVSRRDGAPTTAANGLSGQNVLSADGRYVGFLTLATDLAPGVVDGNFADDLYLFDRVAGTMTLVSHTAVDPFTTGDVFAWGPPALSADGGLVAFLSDASNLVAGQFEPAPGPDVFLFDRSTGQIALVSHVAGAPATAANDWSGPQVAISADGAFVTYQSRATDLVPGQVDGGLTHDAFLYEVAIGVSSLVTRRAGTLAEAAPTAPGFGADGLSLSANGRFVGFASPALDLVSGLVDQDNESDVFLFDRTSGTSVAASLRASSPAAPPSASANGSSTSSIRPGRSASADGRFFVFGSGATNLVPGQADANFANDVFLYERLTGTVTLVSHKAGALATTADGSSDLPAISADGAFVAFRSFARDLVAGQVDPAGFADIFLWERATGDVRLVSHAAGSPLQAASAPSDVGAVPNGDGAFLTFQSMAADLVAGQVDGPSSYDVFLYETLSGNLTLVSRQSGSTATAANRPSIEPVISVDGSSVAFTSLATDLVAGQVDAPRASDHDVFVFERATSTMRIASRIPASPVTTGNGRAWDPVVSADGTWVAFRSQAVNLVTGQIDSNAGDDVFLFHWPTAAMTLVSHVPVSPVTTANQISSALAMSDDAAFVTFASGATNLVTGQVEGNANEDIFLFARAGGAVTLVSHQAGLATTTGNGSSLEAVISADGALVAFRSHARNLVTGQVDGVNSPDVFLYNRLFDTNAVVSHALGTTATAGNVWSDWPVISASGGFVAFRSTASNLVAGDRNDQQDVFLFTTTPAIADLSIDKDDFSPSAVPGTGVVYTITVRNPGPDAAIAALVTDNPPAILGGVTWTCSATPGSSCTASGALAIADFADLLPGGSAVYSLGGTIDPSARGLLDNTATVAAGLGATDPGPGDNSDPDSDNLLPVAELAISLLDAPDPVASGGTLTYTATARNLGPSTATSFEVVVPIPPGTTFVSVLPASCIPGPISVTCPVASLLPGASFVVTLKVLVGGGAVIVNAAGVNAGPEPDPEPSNNSDSVITTILAPAVVVFTVTSKNGSNTLEWLNSMPGLKTVIVASSTACPVDPDLPTDGDRPPLGYLFSGTIAGTKGSFPDPGLTNGQTYYYTAFIDLGSGAFSTGLCRTGRPFDNAVGRPEEAVQWAFSTAATAVTPPGVGESAVFAVSNDRGFHAMRRGPTGGTWPASFTPLLLGEPAQSRPPVVPTSAIPGASLVVFLGSQDGTVYAVDADLGGAPLRQSGPLGDLVQASPAGMFTSFGGDYDLLLVGSRNSLTDNVFQGLHVSDLSGAWQYAGPGDPFGIVSGGAAVDYPTRRLYFASHARGAVRSTLRCLSFTAAGFTEEWKAPVGDVEGSPTLVNGVVYVGNTSGEVHALDARSGALKWTFPTGDGPVRGFIFPDRLSRDRYLSTTGAVWGLVDQGPSVVAKWPEIRSIPNPSIPVLARVGAATYLYVGSSNGNLYEIDAATGVVTGSVALGGVVSVVGAPSFDTPHGLVYVGSDSGVIYAVQAPLP